MEEENGATSLSVVSEAEMRGVKNNGSSRKILERALKKLSLNRRSFIFIIPLYFFEQ